MTVSGLSCKVANRILFSSGSLFCRGFLSSGCCSGSISFGLCGSDFGFLLGNGFGLSLVLCLFSLKTLLVLTLLLACA